MQNVYECAQMCLAFWSFYILFGPEGMFRVKDNVSVYMRCHEKCKIRTIVDGTKWAIHRHLVIIHCAVITQKIFPKISVAQLNWLDRSATSCEWLIDNRASLSLTAKHNFIIPYDDNDGE
jgi:hypothetical protein